MGIVLGILFIVASLAITATVLGSVAIYRSNNAITTTNRVLASTSGSGGSDVTLTGTQTLTNKTLTAPVVTRMLAGGAAPTVALTGGATVVPPSMGSGSSDTAGFILCNGTNSGTAAFSIHVTFSVPYSVPPTSVLILPVQVDATQLGLPVVTWNATGFVFSFPGGAQSPIPNVGLIPFWTYIAL